MEAENTRPDWQSFRQRITDDIPEENPLLSQGEITLLSRGNLLAVSGKAKSLKTFLISGMAAAVEDDCLGLHLDDSARRVLLCDTEQGASHVYKLQRRIYRLCGWPLDKDCDRLVVLALRPLDTTTRFEMIKAAMADVKPDLCIIDGIRDLLRDFNDIKESSLLINELMSLSFGYNCGIICVLHQNKADQNLRGHAGTELVNKAETTLSVVNESGIATVSPAYSRNPPIDQFSFRICDGLPILCEPPKIMQKRKDLSLLMKKAFDGFQCLSRKELRARLVALTEKSEKTANRRIEDALDADVLRLNAQNNLYLTPETDFAEIPF